MHFKKFDINLFVVFDQIWRTRSVSAAADALCVSQPTVSSALKKLRDYFSDKLFVWVNGEMTPTPKAEILIVEIRQVLDRTGSILDQTHFDPLSTKRSISVSTADYVTAALGPYLLDCVGREAPGLRLDFTPFAAQTAFSKAIRAADMYIFPVAVAPATNLSHKIIHRDRYVIVACQSNTAVTNNFSADQFFDTPTVAFSATPNGIDNHEFSWFPQNRALTLKALLPSYFLIPSFVRNTRNIAIVPFTMLRLLDSFDTLKIIDPPIELPPIEAALYWDPVYDDDVLHSWVREKITEAAVLSDQQNEELSPVSL